MRKLTLVALAAAASLQAQNCARDALKAMAANYFKAVESHTLAALPTAANVRVTENAAEIKLGEGFFKTGGKAQLQRTIVDTTVQHPDASGGGRNCPGEERPGADGRTTESRFQQGQ